MASLKWRTMICSTTSPICPTPSFTLIPLPPDSTLMRPRHITGRSANPWSLSCRYRPTFLTAYCPTFPLMFEGRRILRARACCSGTYRGDVLLANLATGSYGPGQPEPDRDSARMAHGNKREVKYPMSATVTELRADPAIPVSADSSDVK